MVISVSPFFGASPKCYSDKTDFITRIRKRGRHPTEKFGQNEQN